LRKNKNAPEKKTEKTRYEGKHQAKNPFIHRFPSPPDTDLPPVTPACSTVSRGIEQASARKINLPSNRMRPNTVCLPYAPDTPKNRERFLPDHCRRHHFFLSISPYSQQAYSRGNFSVRIEWNEAVCAGIHPVVQQFPHFPRNIEPFHPHTGSGHAAEKQSAAFERENT
jgi:hypothetical protein